MGELLIMLVVLAAGTAGAWHYQTTRIKREHASGTQQLRDELKSSQIKVREMHDEMLRAEGELAGLKKDLLDEKRAHTRNLDRMQSPLRRPVLMLAGGSLFSGLLRPYYLDKASLLPARALRISGANRIIDLCAAPGGKGLVLALRMDPEATLTANDRSRARLQRLRRVLEERCDGVDHEGFGGGEGGAP